MTSQRRTVVLIRWLARAVSVLLFFFWGAFFVEHLQEWFLTPGRSSPPLKVWIGQTAHLLLLLGLVVALKWETLGSAMILGAAAVFFGIVGWNATMFFLVTILLGLVLLWCGWRRRTSPPAAG